MNKKYLAFSIVGLFAMALVSGALLLHFGVITTTVEVHQSIKLLKWGEYPEEGNWMNCNPGYDECSIQHDITEDFGEASPGGERFCYKHKLKNQMSVEGEVLFESTCNGYDEEGNWMNCDGIETISYSVPMKTTLVLENKETSTWQPILGDGISATLIFDTIGNNGEFNYDFEATGLLVDTSYVLIYYADRQDRFVNWGGDNPGALIATGSSDGTGNLVMSGSKDINMNLPHPDDWNKNPDPDYCDMNNGFDSYVHCAGAKIWLVPLSDYDEGAKKVNWVQYTVYLYETDLITYFDCDFNVIHDDILVDLADKEDVTNGLTIQSDEVQDFFLCYEFDQNIKPGNYTITTKIV